MTDDDGPTFRPLDPDEYDAFAAVADYAFSPTDGPPGASDDDEEPPERLAERFGVFDDELVSICAHYDFTARLRGEWVPLAGLAAVATPPEHRRRGYVRHLVEASLARWRGDSPLAALWPFDRGYYRQFGWATANTVAEYTCPPEALAFARGRATGRARRVDADEWTALQEAHETHAERRTLTLRRDERWWRKKVFRTDADRADRPHVYVWERDGDVRGHVAYTFSDPGEKHTSHRLDVADLAFADDDAHLGLLGLLADHDSQADEVALTGASTELLDRVPDPSAVDCEVRAGPMVRVVDVADALSACPYPEDATADLTLRVADDTAPWNDGVLELRVADGEGACTRIESESGGADAETDAGEPDQDADVTVDIGTLSQLVVGYRAPAALARTGELDADDATVERLAALFPAESVFLRDFF
mgnify:CR=1 FL=1